LVLTNTANRLDPPDPDAHLSPADRALKARCKTDTRAFAEAFFPEYCAVAFSAMHLAWFAQWAADDQGDTRGLREATAAPRGNAKTTLRGLIRPVQRLVYGQERFLVVISSRHDMARDKVKEIRHALEREAITRVFGAQKGPKWNDADFVTTAQEGRPPARVLAASPGSQIRGLNWQGQRPSLIILDDAEHSEHVHTVAQREKFWRWLTSDILKLGSPRTNVDVVGTILHEKSLLARLLETPGWRGRKYQAVLRWADEAPHLWAEWRERFCRADRPRDQAAAEARAFFEAHRDAMLAGHDVLWPEREPYYDLMVMLVMEGETAFATEKQNEPSDIGDRPFRLEDAAYVTLIPEGLQRADGSILLWHELTDYAAYWDPALGLRDGAEGEPDYSCCVVGAKDTHGFFYVLDTYLSNTDPPDVQCLAVARLLYQWQVPKIGVETIAFASLLVPDLKEAMAQVLLEAGEPAGSVTMAQILEVRTQRNKELRIATLVPVVNNRWLAFTADLPGEFFRQFRVWAAIPESDADDACDATEGLIRTLKGLFDKKAQTH
jgi:hypothetical protein